MVSEKQVKRIMITGGAGCLGAGLIQHFTHKGCQVFAFDNFSTGDRANLPLSDALEFKSGSIADKAFLRAFFFATRPDVVVHCAASYKDPDDLETDAAVNIGGMLNLIEVCRESNVQRVVNLQTVLAYGQTGGERIDERQALVPFTSYGISKTAAEWYLQNSGLNFVSLRLANVTGPRLAIGPIPTFYTRLREGKPCFCSKATRDFLDFRDFATCIDAVIEKRDVVGSFNVSSGIGHSIRDVYDCVRSHLNLAPDPDVRVTEVGQDDVEEVVLNSDLAMRTFDWRPKFAFEEAIKSTLEWYDVHGVGRISSHLRATSESDS